MSWRWISGHYRWMRREGNSPARSLLKVIRFGLGYKIYLNGRYGAFRTVGS